MIKVMFVCKNFCFIHFKYIKIIIITHFCHVYLVMLLLLVVIIQLFLIANKIHRKQKG